MRIMATTPDTADINIHLRARPQDRALIDRAAELTGTNRSQFMLAASLRDARNVVADQTAILVDQKAFQSILAWMEAEPTEAEKIGMRRLLKAGTPRG